MITKEDFEQWKANPVTEEVMDVIREIRKIHMEALAYGGTLNTGSMEETFGNTAKTIGIIEGIDELLNLKIGED